MSDSETPERILMNASGQQTPNEAVLWFAEGHPVLGGYSFQAVLGALCAMAVASEEVDSAILAVAKEAAKSDFDPSTVLFRIATAADPSRIRRCLDELAYRSPTKTLMGLTPNSVEAALAEEPDCLDVLALVAALTPNELKRRLGSAAPRGATWKLREIKSALELIDAIVEGTLPTSIPGATPARPIEMLRKGKSSLDGWQLVENMRTGGVAYEVLLAQREAGSAWQSHRNATSSVTGSALVDELCKELDHLGIAYLRSSTRGGTENLEKKSPVGKVAALLTMPRSGEAGWSVIVSVATDTGTANKTAAQLCDLVEGKDRVAVLLAGPGWAERPPETADLARRVHGHIYSERHIGALARAVADTAPYYIPGGTER